MASDGDVWHLVEARRNDGTPAMFRMPADAPEPAPATSFLAPAKPPAKKLATKAKAHAKDQPATKAKAPARNKPATKKPATKAKAFAKNKPATKKPATKKRRTRSR